MCWYSYYGVAVAEFAERVLGVKYTKDQSELLAQWVKLTKAGAWFFPFDGFCVLMRNPVRCETDERGMIHGAVEYADGWGIYAFHGTTVPKHVMDAPATITVKEVDDEKNAEVRRAMVAQMGAGKYLLAGGAKELHRDEFGVLYRKEVPGDEPIVMIRVLNSTSTHDGTLDADEARKLFGPAARYVTADGRYKEFFLRVPPETTTAREGAAWGAQLAAEAYAPMVET